MAVIERICAARLIAYLDEIRDFDGISGSRADVIGWTGSRGRSS
jgi:hypothetical protein